MPPLHVTLGPACIETAASALRNRLESMVLGGNDSANVTEALATLTAFLEEMDFAALRASQPELDGRTNTLAAITRTADGFSVTEE